MQEKAGELQEQCRRKAGKGMRNAGKGMNKAGTRQDKGMRKA